LSGIIVGRHAVIPPGSPFSAATAAATSRRPAAYSRPRRPLRGRSFPYGLQLVSGDGRDLERQASGNTSTAAAPAHDNRRSTHDDRAATPDHNGANHHLCRELGAELPRTSASHLRRPT
jgi:hypothetical protein